MLRLGLRLPWPGAWLSVCVLMVIKTPETTAGKVTLGAAILVAATSFTTMGAAVIMWEKVRPWQSEAQIRASSDRDDALVRELLSHRRELVREDAEIKARACENTLARLQSSLFQAQANEVAATERAVTLADADAKTLNRKMIQQAKEAQHTFAEQYDHEKRECGF